MLARSALALAAVLASLCVSMPDASAEDASAWSETKGGAVRLVPGAASPDGAFRAGVEIRLDPGWKTYWRNPGDSGIPPRFDWSGSRNLQSVEVAFPAPVAFTDPAGSSIGYKEDVVFPLTVRPADKASPVHLSLKLDFAVCETICVPAEARADITLEPGRSGPASLSARIEASATRVPLPELVGASGPLSVVAIQLKRETTPPLVTIEVRSADVPSLFVEGPEDWFLPLPEPTAMAPLSGGTHVFALPLKGLPKGAMIAGTPLTFTLVGADGAVESRYTLP